MPIKHFMRAVAFAVALISGAAIAAGEFEGTWKTQDTDGKPFELTLSADGSAKGNRGGEALTGGWRVEGESALIDWGDGWVTKITKEGSEFKKYSYQNGEPRGTAGAEKVK